MSKLSKRLSKLVKFPRNAIVVGPGFGYLEEISDFFQTVFILGLQTPPLYKKNIVFRETFDNLEILLDVDAMFFDKTSYQHFKRLQTVWNFHKSLIIVEGNELSTQPDWKFLKTIGYQITNIHDEYHIWKFGR
jgi:hypothetical protein